MDRKPSEIISEFLNFLESSKIQYENAYSDVGKEDAKLQTFIHDIEFAATDGELFEIAVRLRESRQERRKQKDIVQMLEHPRNFCIDKHNQELMKALRRLQNEQNTMEKYLFGNREFKNRVD